MGVLSSILPDVTTYTGLNAGNPFGDPTMGGENDGNDNNQQAIIRRNPSDLEEFPIAPAPISDELASDYLQNPFYLYSGQNNLYQPYGYCLLYTSPSPRDGLLSRMPSSA